MSLRALILGLSAVLVGLSVPPSHGKDGASERPDQVAAVRADVVELKGYVDLVVDDGHGRVFVSQGTSKLVVANTELTRSRSIDLPTRAQGMVLSEDGATLYVAGNGQADLVAVDTGSLEVQVVTPSLSDCARGMAVAADLLWVVSDCEATPGLVAVDPGSGTVTTISNRRLGTIARTSADQLIVAGVKGDTAVELLAVAKEPIPSARTLAVRIMRSDLVGDIAVVPTRSEVWLALKSRDVAWLELPSLDYRNKEYTGGPPTVAARADGLMATVNGGSGLSFYEADGRWWGDMTAAKDGEVFPAGMAFGATHLYYAVAPADTTQPPYLTRIWPRRSSYIEQGPFSPKAVEVGTPISFKGRLITESPSREIRVYRRTRTGPDELVRVLEAGPKGHFSGTVRATQTMRIRVVFPGDEETQSDSALFDQVSVIPAVRSRLGGQARTVDGVSVYRASGRAVLSGAVRPAAPGACVEVILWVRVEGRWRIAGRVCARQTDGGRFRAHLDGSRDLVGPLWSMQATVRGTGYYLDGEDERKIFRFTD